MWPPETIYPQKNKRKYKDLEAPALQRKENKDSHPLNTHLDKDPLHHYSNYKIKRPTTPLYKPITKQTTVIFIQTYTLV